MIKGRPPIRTADFLPRTGQGEVLQEAIDARPHHHRRTRPTRRAGSRPTPRRNNGADPHRAGNKRGRRGRPPRTTARPAAPFAALTAQGLDGTVSGLRPGRRPRRAETGPPRAPDRSPVWKDALDLGREAGESRRLWASGRAAPRCRGSESAQGVDLAGRLGRCGRSFLEAHARSRRDNLEVVCPTPAGSRRTRSAPGRARTAPRLQLIDADRRRTDGPPSARPEGARSPARAPAHSEGRADWTPPRLTPPPRRRRSPCSPRSRWTPACSA